MTQTFEKLPMQSKKFIAFLVAEATWKLVLILMIALGDSTWVVANLTLMLTIVLVAGFIEVGFVISQSALDKFVRLAQITAKAEVDRAALPKPEAAKIEEPKK